MNDRNIEIQIGPGCVVAIFLVALMVMYVCG